MDAETGGTLGVIGAAVGGGVGEGESEGGVLGDEGSRTGGRGWSSAGPIDTEFAIATLGVVCAREAAAIDAETEGAVVIGGAASCL